MLRFNKIEMENFGTYKGIKEVDFTNRDGVTIVWGNNGFGKTTLLNAFKFVLFNKVVGRENKETPKRQLINWDSSSKGNHSFRVSLFFQMDAVEYILIRRYYLAQPELDPSLDKNYKESVQLFENGSILSPDRCQHVIDTIMPEQVSRFFLFDGELLKEYEELLHEEKSIGQKIKQSIEEILGVPILTNSLADTQSICSRYENALAVAAQKSADHKTQGEALSRENAKVQKLREDLTRLLADKAAYASELSEKEAIRAKNERIQQLIEEITKLEEDKSKSEKSIVEKRAKICEYSSEAWRSALAATVKEIISTLSVERTTLEEKRQRYEGAKKMLETMRKSLTVGRCSLCEATLSSEKIQEINAQIDTLERENSPLTTDELNRLDAIKEQISKLSEIVSGDVYETILLLEDQICDLIVDVADSKQRINDLRADIDNFSAQKKEMEEINDRIKTLTALLANVEQGIKNLQADIDECDENIRKAKQRLVAGGSSDVEYTKLQTKSKFCADLRDLINDSLDTYRKYLKQQVEEDATNIFLNLSSDPAYERLKINDNFGLNIVHENGQVIEVRSAGFEHIVALSLIGALHRNAPLQGPIVMDSPFGRLDSVHEHNIISYLPNLANQVMLFVFDKEINEQSSRQTLGGSLIQELELVRGETFETVIRRK
ncbi:MAG: AAA family ATPase [Clostridia bacterium]|nr:AAA family ATPase [Clostridia bacterium]